MPDLPSILGTIPGWITAGGVMTGLGMLLKNQLDTRKLSIEDREAIRSGYAATEARNTLTIAGLTKDCVDLRDELKRTRRDADQDREDCYRVTDALRTIVTSLREEIAGLRMNALAKDAASIRGVILPPNEVSPAMERALATIDEVTGGRSAHDEERETGNNRFASQGKGTTHE